MKSPLFIIGLILSTANAFDKCHDDLVNTREQTFTLDDMEITPLASNNLKVEISGTSLIPLSDPLLSLDLGLLGIVVEDKTVKLCNVLERSRKHSSWLRTTTDERQSCSIKKGEQFTATIFVQVPSTLVESFEIDFSVTVSDNSLKTCYSHGQYVDGLAHESFMFTGERQRFGFSETEVGFLFNKWVTQHLENIYLPPSPSDGNGLYHASSVLAERKGIFRENLIKVAVHNANKKETFKMKLNQFAHLTSQEFKYIYASGMRQELSRRPLYKKQPSPYLWKQLPSEVNWVKRGAVTEVKNQGACGSCWSFATTGAIEGAYFRKTGKLVSFSEQELVSCDYVDLGCNGGAMDNGYQFAQEQGGLCTEDEFPYTSGQGVRGFCNVTCTPVKDSAPTGIVDVEHDMESLMQAVAQQPVAVAIEADEAAFQFYSSGVLTAQCSQKLDHGVLVVGYGNEDGVDYWLVKNSWGPMWGLGGYIKLERGIQQQAGGECGILLGPSYPVL